MEAELQDVETELQDLDQCIDGGGTNSLDVFMEALIALSSSDCAREKDGWVNTKVIAAAVEHSLSAVDVIESIDCLASIGMVCSQNGMIRLAVPIETSQDV